MQLLHGIDMESFRVVETGRRLLIVFPRLVRPDAFLHRSIPSKRVKTILQSCSGIDARVADGSAGAGVSAEIRTLIASTTAVFFADANTATAR
jgi:hypothetical protein